MIEVQGLNRVPVWVPGTAPLLVVCLVASGRLCLCGLLDGMVPCAVRSRDLRAVSTVKLVA